MKYYLSIGLIFVISLEIYAQITFSEVMFNPETSEYHDEYIEIFNLSHTDTLDLSDWELSDGTGIDLIKAHTSGTKIAPRSFGIILDRSYFENSTTYDHIIPDSAVIITIADNSLGSNGLSNTISETLTLIDKEGLLIASYSYSIDNQPGYSDEKVVLEGYDDSDNWGNSIVKGGTPGYRNSIAPYHVDPGLGELSLNLPDIIFAGDRVQIGLLIHNFGLDSLVGELDLVIFADRDNDSTLSARDILITEDKQFIRADKTAELEFTWQTSESGYYLIVVHIAFSGDQNLTNNKIYKPRHIFSRETDLAINEIYFKPEADEPEWIELANYGSKTIYLKHFGLCDLTDTVLIDTGALILPGQVKVISDRALPEKFHLPDSMVIKTESFLALNNTQDEIRLLKPEGGWLEFVRYNISWLENHGDKNVSLERINSRLNANRSANWGPSVSAEGATPGEQNSIYTNLPVHQIDLLVQPNPFSPNADGVDDIVAISGHLPVLSARIRIGIYDIQGRLIRSVADGDFTGSTFHLVWDGFDWQGNLARMGIYVIFVEALDDRNGILIEQKASVVLAQFL